MGDKGDCYYIMIKGRALFSIPSINYTAKPNTSS